MRLGGWLLGMSARRLVPLLLSAFALLSIGLRYQYQMGRIESEVAAEETARLRERLNIEQSRLDPRLGMDDTLQLRRLVGALALHDGVERAYLVDGAGTLEASLSRLDLGRPLAEVLGDPSQPPELRAWLARANPRAIEVETDAARPSLRAVVPLQEGHRLLVWQDLTRPVAVRRNVVQSELAREAVAVLLAVAALALLLHLLWFRRARQLAATLASIGSGDLTVRSQLQGRDELAHIGEQTDRMVAQLQAEQAQLRQMSALIDRSPLVVIEWANRAGWPVVQVSEGIRQWGHEPEQLLSGELQYNDLFHPDDESRVNTEIADYVARGVNSYRQEYRIRRADGRWAWVDDRTSLQRDAEGQVLSFSGVLLDITPQKEAEQAQREQAEVLRLFFDLPFLGMAVSSPTEKRWLQVNDRLCEILGYSRDELLRLSWAELTPPDDLERDVELFDELLAGQRDGYQLAKRFVRKDGRIVHTEIDVKALREPDGRVRQLFATVQDVTERKTAEAELRRLSTMADNASDALILTVGGRFEDCNPAAVRLFGCRSRADFLGHTPAELSPVLQPDGRPSDEAAAMLLASAMGGQPQHFEWQHRRSDGTVFDAEVGLVRFQLPDGRFAVLGIVRDITERKAAEEALRRSQAMLLRAQEIARMGSWSQDLRTGEFTWSPQTYAIHEIESDGEPLSLDKVVGLLHPDDAARARQRYEEALAAGGQPYDIRYRLRMADGRVKHLLVKVAFEFDSGQPVRSVGMVVDETELLEAQRDRDRLVSVLENTTDIVSMADGQGRVFYFNRAGYEVLGLPSDQPLDDVIGRVHPSWAARLVQEEGIPTAIREGSWLGETAVLDAQGREVPMSQLIMAHRGEDGEVDYVWTILRDITERKAAEMVLERERKQLADAQAVAHVGSWIIQMPGAELIWSDEQYRVLGFEPQSVSPSLKTFLSVVHPDDLDRVSAQVEEDMQRRTPGFSRTEYRIVTPQGIRHVEQSANVEVDARGEVVRIVGTTMDITERIKAQQALSEANDMLEQGESVGRMGSFAYDAQTRELRWSRQAFATIGLPWSPHPPSIDEYCACIHPDDAPGVRATIDLLLAGSDVPEVRFRTHPQRGPVRWLRRVYQRIDRAEEGLKPRYIGTMQDITEIQEAEEKLRRVNQELEQRVTERTAQLRQANQELEAFSYTVSHDLKAPLRGIDGYSQLLVEEYGPKLDEEGRQFVQRVRHGVQLMSDLINDLLEYSRMERRDMARDPVALQPLVQQVIEGYEADIRQLGAQVQVDLPPLTLPLDREGMAVVMRNLVGNALKFSRDSRPPVIAIGGQTQDGRHRLWVRDNGVGFDMKYHDRVFAIFQRLHRAEDFAGTGVGLALVAKAVQRMGGRVWAESAPGAGATFYLEFSA